VVVLCEVDRFVYLIRFLGRYHGLQQIEVVVAKGKVLVVVLGHVPIQVLLVICGAHRIFKAFGGRR